MKGLKLQRGRISVIENKFSSFRAYVKKGGYVQDFLQVLRKKICMWEDLTQYMGEHGVGLNRY